MTDKSARETTDLVEKCARAARRIEHRGCCTGAALEDTVNMPISVREREGILAVIDALADGVNDEMVHAFRRIEHEHCCLGAALNDVATRPVDNQERRALSAAIRAALMLRREGDRHD